MDERRSNRLHHKEVREVILYPKYVLHIHFLNFDPFFRILNGIPNTYAFTKALAESLVAAEMDNLPTVILRPSIGKMK